MGFLDKAKEMLGKHDDKVDEALDKAGGAAKQRYPGHDEQIDKVTQMGKDYDFSGGSAPGKPAPAGEQAPPTEQAPSPPAGQQPPPPAP